ncbi:hypothetical protein NDU88_001723 [Pleurodeles waltl]|uniref:Secreted protein n=1 Tax=Pleurodeles waltl TaxID=8319 RepID=A0AAV7LAA4_PLEWA|nr:hypothetical protein NDU88_001723 [Pleurodeles waltl]
MLSCGESLVVLLLPLVQVLLLLIRVPPLVWVPPLVRVPLLVQESLPCVVSRLPLPLFPFSPGLRREGLYKALRHPEVELDRFLPDLHPGFGPNRRGERLRGNGETSVRRQQLVMGPIVR